MSRWRSAGLWRALFVHRQRTDPKIPSPTTVRYSSKGHMIDADQKWQRTKHGCTAEHAEEDRDSGLFQEWTQRRCWYNKVHMTDIRKRSKYSVRYLIITQQHSTKGRRRRKKLKTSSRIASSSRQIPNTSYTTIIQEHRTYTTHTYTTKERAQIHDQQQKCIFRPSTSSQPPSSSPSPPRLPSPTPPPISSNEPPTKSPSHSSEVPQVTLSPFPTTTPGIPPPTRSSTFPKSNLPRILMCSSHVSFKLTTRLLCLLRRRMC